MDRTHFVPVKDRLGNEVVIDLYRLGEFLEVDFRNKEEGACVRISFLYEGNSAELGIVDLRCSGVLRMVLPEFKPRAFATEIELEDVQSHQIEGARFSLKDHGMSTFEIICRDVDFSIQGL